MRILTRFVPGLVLTLVFTTVLGAQRTDTTARGATPGPAGVSPNDSLRAPISPRRAFFFSFLAPGYSQGVLGRHKAATAFMVVEAISIIMIRESAADVHEARRLANDTVVVSYTDPSNPAGAVTAPPQFNGAYVHAREAHVEDWIALLIANHLFAGADAYVAAHLWDVNAQLGMRLTPSGGVLAASFKF